MNKRIISSLVCLILVVSLMIQIIPVVAANTTEVTFIANKSQAKAGDTITYTVTLGPVEHLNNGGFTLVLPEGITYSGYSIPSGLKEQLAGTGALEWTESSLSFNFYGDADYSSTSDTILLTVTGTVNAGATGTLELALYGDEDLGNTSWQSISGVVWNTEGSRVKIIYPATGVNLNKSTLTLVDGTSDTLTATVSPTNSTDNVTWKSSNNSVATVDSNGNVSAIAKGNATITATAGNFSDTCDITVKCSHSGKVSHQAKTNANCQEQNYGAYYLCSCGQYLAADGTTEISGIPYTGYGSHSYGADWDNASSNETKHYHKCSVCQNLDAGENHTVGTLANCVDKIICGECNKAYGDVNPANHKTPTSFKYVKIDENNHKKLYDCCSAEAIATEPHIYDDANDMICNNCNYDKTHYCGNGTFHKGSTADCTTMTDGEKDYYVCSCGRKYYDATCLNPVLDSSDLVISWKHSLTYHNADSASCWENGTNEYWSCSNCNKNFGSSDERDTVALTTIVAPATGLHNFGTAWIDGGDGYHYHECTTTGCTAKDTVNKQAHNGGNATCQSGKICIVCLKEYGDKDKENHVSNDFVFEDNGDGTHTKKNKCCGSPIGEPAEHTFGDDNICDICNYDKTHYCGNATLIKGKEATCSENGIKDSYKCLCGKVYLDATCKILVTKDADLVIATTSKHVDSDKNSKCDVCGVILDSGEVSPKTGDNSNVICWIFLASVAIVLFTGAIACLKKKKENYFL